MTNIAMIGRDETILKFHITNKMITVISIFLVLSCAENVHKVLIHKLNFTEFYIENHK